MASSSSSSTEGGKMKMIRLRTSDGEEFEVEEAVAVQSQTIRHMIEDDCADNTIPLPNVTARVLSKVLEYCKKHLVHKDDDASLKSWDAKFLKFHPTLFDLILAANYLDVKGLLDLTCQAAADKIKDKTPEEVREIFNIENDFTTEEEAAVRNENKWAFE